MIFRKYSVVGHYARTLCADCVGQNSSGWFVRADIQEDWYKWVNYFEAFHPDYGLVFGDFEQGVFASCERTLEQFIADHPYEDWDYWDI